MPDTYLIPQYRNSLGRHVHHDPLSRRFPYNRGAAAAPQVAVRHTRHIPIFDQGDLGKCTAETMLGLLGTSPYWDALRAIDLADPVVAGPYPLTDQGTSALYADITAYDPFDGQWPPEDTGSDGLSAAKALVRAGIVPGYQHTFSLAEALRALADYPLAVGTLWTDSMFNPDRRGLIRYTGAENAIGGHEWIADEYLPDDALIGGTTSWGESFGAGGRFYLNLSDFAQLLADDGDVIVLAAPAAPRPMPDPAVGPAVADRDDVALAAAMRQWLNARDL